MNKNAQKSRKSTVVLWLAAILLMAVIFYFPYNVAGYWTHFMTGLFIWIVIALAWNFVGGMGYISLSVGAWYGLGSYSTGLLVNSGWNFFAAALVSAVWISIFSVLLSIPLLRLKSHYFIMGTFIVAYVIQLYMHQTNLFGLSGGASLQVSSPSLEPDAFNRFFYFLSFGFAAITVAIFYIVKQRRMGYALQAIGQDEATAEMSGTPTTRYKLTAFGISTFFITVAGSINGYWAGYLDAGTYFSLLLSIKAIIMSVLGGLGTLAGPIYGAVIIQLIEQVFGPSLNNLSQIVYGIIIIVVVVLLPKGIHSWLLSLIAGLFGRKNRGQSDAKEGSVSDGPSTQPSGERHERVEVLNEPPLPQVPLQNSGTSAEPILRLVDSHKSFGQFQAVKGVDLVLKPGEILGVIGPNGSGKTTVVNLLSGMHSMTKGKLLLGDQDASKWAAHKRCQWGLARTFQIVRPFQRMTVFENAVIGALFGTDSKTTLKEAEEIAGQVLEDVGLIQVRNKTAASLPIQQLKALEVAHALASRPKVILLDEVLAGLTHGKAEEMLELIVRKRNSGLGILFIEHRLQALLRVSDRVMVLNEGRLLIEGSPQEIAHDPQVMEVYLGLKSNKEEVL